ncbi:MAG: bifunctional demethylmenaquinone methyltransferase/2-methoxy-6-polyprenyl-1,4-benzoquinol methylase UbiE [Planctomycetota bacterium]|jgi:demethylmenaquinone methyltransferase/2-methoxy-6-polyprenyl-1,4-benzoquinol methylase
MTRSAPSSSEPVWTATDLGDDPHRVPDKADRVRTMFGAIAGRYDLNNRLHSFGRDQAWRRRTVRLCTVRPTDDVLDVACGTGDLAEAFADAGPATVTGLDFTPPMLELARTKAGARRRSSRAPMPEYVHGDAMDLPFEDGRFDVVSIAFGIRNVTDPARAIAEFHRVLRPGGRLAVLEFSEPENRLLRAMNRIYTTRVMPVTATWLARDRTGAYRYLPRSVDTFLDRRQMSRTIADAGFDEVRGHPMTFGVCVCTLGVKPG